MTTTTHEDCLAAIYLPSDQEIDKRLKLPFDQHSNDEIWSECARFLLLARLKREPKRDFLLLQKSLLSTGYPQVAQSIRTAIATLITKHLEASRQSFRGSDEAIALLRQDLKERSFEPEVAKRIRRAIRSRDVAGMYEATRKINLNTPLVGVKVFGRTNPKKWPVQTPVELLLGELSMLLSRVESRLQAIENAVMPSLPALPSRLTFSDRFEEAYDRKLAEISERKRREAERARRAAAKQAKLKSKAQDLAKPSKPSRDRRAGRSSSKRRR